MKQSIIYGVALSEILLIVSLAVCFAYFVHQTDFNRRNTEFDGSSPSQAAFLFATLGNLMFGKKGFASALESNDVQSGVQTCLLSKDGKSCQEYIASECVTKCASACVPSPRKNVAACKPGTCYNLKEGTCQAGSPQSTCTGNGGQWFDDPFANVPQCRAGCGHLDADGEHWWRDHRSR